MTAYRVLMTWVYANTRSLVLAVLMHARYPGWLLTLYPAASREQGLIWQTGFAIALWIVVAVVMAGRAGRWPWRPMQHPPSVDASGETR